MGYPGEIENFPLGEKFAKALTLSTSPGVGDQDLHLQHMDMDGISKSVMFPRSLPSFVRLPDLDVLEQMYRTYNEYIAELQTCSGGCTVGVGVFTNWLDPAAAERSMQQIVDPGAYSGDREQ